MHIYKHIHHSCQGSIQEHPSGPAETTVASVWGACYSLPLTAGNAGSVMPHWTVPNQVHQCNQSEN